MQLPNMFDATGIDPTQTGGQLPVGKHPVVIETSEVKATSSNTGGMLVLNLKVIDGPAVGSVGPYRLNLWNASQQAKDIAARQMSAICHVTGVYQVPDSSLLHNIPFIVEVGLQNDPESAAKGYTEIKRVFDINGNEPLKGGQNGGNAQPQQNNGGGQPQQNAAWGGGQPQQNNVQQNQQPAQNNAAWGQPQPNTQQPAQQNNSGAAWGQQNTNQQQQPAAQPQNTGNAAPGNWQPNQQPNNGGGQPAWGQNK